MNMPFLDDDYLWCQEFDGRLGEISSSTAVGLSVSTSADPYKVMASISQRDKFRGPTNSSCSPSQSSPQGKVSSSTPPDLLTALESSEIESYFNAIKNKQVKCEKAVTQPDTTVKSPINDIQKKKNIPGQNSSDDKGGGNLLISAKDLKQEIKEQKKPPIFKAEPQSREPTQIEAMGRIFSFSDVHLESNFPSCNDSGCTDYVSRDSGIYSQCSSMLATLLSRPKLSDLSDLDSGLELSASVNFDLPLLGGELPVLNADDCSHLDAKPGSAEEEQQSEPSKSLEFDRVHSTTRETSPSHLTLYERRRLNIIAANPILAEKLAAPTAPLPIPDASSTLAKRLGLPFNDEPKTPKREF
ncbi:uncharacterized protein LOC136038751 isoform X4 [Artemia franciscana]|uniref:Uncharacterized protein n=1 Tax=Artemia franciscana TaxID=6661 RepID=A0AA88L426_ARTSF|nr:hypothetical protein QYM36_006738 [Artemia franciscana]